MSDSRIPAALDKLVEIFTAGVPEDVDIIDGPIISGSEPQKRVFVGYNGDPDSDWLPAATSDQDWAGTLGTGRRNENFSIDVAVICHNGGGNSKVARDDAFAVLAVLATVLRANVSLGFPMPSNAQLRNPSLSYALTSNTGVEARIACDINVSTRI